MTFYFRKSISKIKWIPIIDYSIFNGIFSFLLIALVPTAFYLAKNEANKQAILIRIGNAKKITLVFKKDSTPLYPKEFIDANNEGQLKLLIQTNERYYVLYQPQGEGNAIPIGFTYDIPRTDIVLANTEIRENSKKELNNE